MGHSAETRRKIGEANRNPSAETRRRKAKAAKGRRHSAETRAKIGEASRRKTMSPEARRKISEAQIGRKHSEETKRRKSEALRGKYQQEVVGYEGAHRRIWQKRGKAQDYLCELCGNGAQQWALDHSSPTRVENGRRYSLNPDAYHPLCRSCHTQADNAGGFRA